jgi:hypothetical protein
MLSIHPAGRCLAFPLAAVLAAPSVALAADLAFVPAALNFNSVALTESKTLTATFKNASALGVNITGVAIAGASAAAFTQTNDCPKPVPAGQGCKFTVTFKPAALSKRTATLTVSTDDPAQAKVNLALSGNLYGALNDTGITQCADAIQNGLKCPVTGFPRQDAEYGRDKTRNNDADGHAGFSFTKLDANGKVLPATATSWKCVRDNVTGLIWEVKPKRDGTKGNQGLHDADDTYTWYSTDSTNNGGFAGYPDESSNRACYGYASGAAKTYCNTEAFAKRVNAVGWCGYKDWRMPTRKELLGLVDLSVGGPAIETGYFPDTSSSSYYWAASPVAYGSYYAWNVSFYEGGSSDGNRYSGYSMRLVRSGQ